MLTDNINLITEATLQTLPHPLILFRSFRIVVSSDEQSRRRHSSAVRTTLEVYSKVLPTRWGVPVFVDGYDMRHDSLGAIPKTKNQQIR